MSFDLLLQVQKVINVRFLVSKIIQNYFTVKKKKKLIENIYKKKNILGIGHL